VRPGNCTTKIQMPPKIALIGAGWAARNAHLPSFRAAGVQVDAICDLNPVPAQTLAKQYGIPNVYTDYKEMIEREKPDSVHVLLPNAAHREPVLFALAAGANVLCEKPIATSTAEAREMFDAAKAAGRTLMAAQSWRFESPSRAIKHLIDAGELGEIYYGEATAMRRMGIPMWGLFHYKEHSHGGALLDIGVHMLDLAIWLMGNPKPVRVSSMVTAKFGKRPEFAKMLRNAWDPEKFDVDDFSISLVHFANGASLILRVSWAAHIPDEQLFDVRVLGTEAGVTLAPPMLYRTSDGIPIDGKLQIDAGSGYEREIAHWLKVLSGEAEPIVKREETMNVQRILDAAYRSAEQGREVTVEA
jgi:predicted dehydrogenase